MTFDDANALLPRFSSAPPVNWAERHGPWILSLCLHFLAFSWLILNVAVPSFRGPEPESVQVRMVSKPRIEENEERTEPSVLPPMAVVPARATVSNPESEPSELRAQGNDPAAEETVSAARATVADGGEDGMSDDGDSGGDSEEQRIRIRNIVEGYRKQAGRSRAERRDRMKDIDGRLEKISIAASGYDHFPDYKGARVGAVRTFSDEGVDRKTVEEVKARYGIRITTRFLEKPGGLSYLNSAATGGSVYRPADKAGYYEVFEISEKAYRQMVILENEWLVTHGYDPARTRIDTVEFGIVERSPGFWDLGIVRAKVQELTSPGQPTTTKPMTN